MERSHYALLSATVWLVVYLVADGWMRWVAAGIMAGWVILYWLAEWMAYRDKKAASRVETWRR